MKEVINTKAENEVIDKKYKKISSNISIHNDARLLLNDGIQSLKNNLYFSSILVFTAFIEKHVRDSYVSYIYHKNRDSQEVEFYEYLEEVEHKVEEWGREFSFKNLCRKSKDEELIDEDFMNDLVNFYNDLRIPAQHAIYQRLIRKYEVAHSVWFQRVSFWEGASWDEIMEHINDALANPCINTYINNTNPIVRTFKMNDLFKMKSFEALDLIVEVVTRYEKRK